MLTARQQAFVDHYLTCGNAAEAARLAGYAAGSAKVTGSRLLASEDVRKALERRQNALREDFLIDRSIVLSQLVRAAHIAKMKGDPANMIKGWVAIAKMCGFFEPERPGVRLSGDCAALQDRYAGMSDANLLELLDPKKSGEGVRPPYTPSGRVTA